jgi:Ca-activated chloride channel homolog
MQTRTNNAVKPIVLIISALLIAACKSSTSDNKPVANERSQATSAPAKPEAKVAADAAAPALESAPVMAEPLAPAPVSTQASAPMATAPVAELARRAPPPGAPADAEMDQPAQVSAADKALDSPQVDQENYAASEVNPIQLVSEQAISTFSVDVDTGSYTNVRRMLVSENRLPPVDAVRAEEFINYFDYQYQGPANRSQPFSVTTELGTAPWNSERELLLVGLQGYQMQKSEIPPVNLVLLLDVSGSMDEPDKLPLLKASLLRMTERLGAKDRVAIVVYAGAAGLVLPSTPANDFKTISRALENLSAGGSTNGGEGIALAYKIAQENLIEGGINRILLATDGDFNVGQFDPNQLKKFVAKQRESGVQLSTLGFGAGNYNDEMAEQLADVGNGKYAYIDSLKEADKVLGRELVGSLFTIASDVKVQIEFNPAQVSEYRLIGYANRMLAREDFNNDKVDAGDIGVGHRVTALYEITRVGAKASMDPSRYQSNVPARGGNELAFLKLRYKLPNQSKSTLIETPIAATQKSSQRFQDAANIAAFAESLQGGKYLQNYDLSALIANMEKSALPAEQKSELLELMQRAQELQKGAKPVQISATQ